MSPRPARYAQVLAPGVTLALVDYPAGLVQPRHRDGCGQVSLVLAGGVREVTDYGEAEARPLDVICKAIDLPHGDVFAPTPTRLLSLRLEPADGVAGLLRDTMPPGTWRARQADRRLIAHFRLGAFAITRDSRLIDPSLLAVDLQALLCDMAPIRGGLPPAWLVRARERLSEEFRAPVRLEALARDTGVHPVTLSRAFRLYFRETASQLVTRLRVRDAAARLASAERLSAVAYGAGFADQSHLTRHFRRATGLTPGGFRAFLRTAPDYGPAGVPLTAPLRTLARGRPPGGTRTRPAPPPAPTPGRTSSEE